MKREPYHAKYYLQFLMTLAICGSLSPVSLYASEKGLLPIEFFLSTLKAKVSGLNDRIVLSPNSISLRVELSRTKYKIARYQDDLYGVQQSIDDVSEAIFKGRKTPEKLGPAYLLRAKEQLTLHRFRSAQSDLSKAKKLGANQQVVDALQGDIDWNLGHYKKAIPQLRKSAAVDSSVASMIRLAILEHHLGNYTAAEKGYKKSLAMFRGTDPIIYAWLLVQHGIHKLELNNLKVAKKLFEKAVKIAPKYTLAREHLAETETKLGQIDRAIMSYRQVLVHSGNPEFMGSLAALLIAQKYLGESKALISQAEKKYRQLIKDFPEAMYAHAGEFFLEHSDKKMALKLAMKNMKLRPNSDAYVDLAKVQYALGLLESAKKNATIAVAMPKVSLELCDLAQKLNLLKKSKHCFVFGNKNDFNDAAAIFDAVTRHIWLQSCSLLISSKFENLACNN